MRALQWTGPEKVAVNDIPVPDIGPNDLRRDEIQRRDRKHAIEMPPQQLHVIGPEILRKQQWNDVVAKRDQSDPDTFLPVTVRCSIAMRPV